MARQTNLCHTTLQLPFKVLEFLTAFLEDQSRGLETYFRN